MNLKISPICTIKTFHEYYNGISPDISCKLLSDNKNFFTPRTTNGELRIYIAITESGQPIIPISQKILRIALYSQSPFFSYVTEGDFFQEKTRIYRNLVSSMVEHAKRPVVGKILRHALKKDLRPVRVSLRDEIKSELSIEIQPQNPIKAPETKEVTALINEPVGMVELLEEYPDNTKESTFYYLAPGLATEALLAVAEVKLESSFLANPPTFTIPFQAKREKLAYYIVANKYNAGEVANFKIVDAGFTVQKRPEITFENPVLAAAFTAKELPPEMLNAAGAEVALVRSTSEVPRMQMARRKIQLKHNNTVLIEDLAAPSVERATTEMIVHLSKP